MSTPRDSAECYTHAGNQALDPYLGGRTAAVSAAFLLPWLRSGQNLLDCGCAFGAITRGFVPHVAPGRVIGVDVDAGQLARAGGAVDAAAPHYCAASVYALPFSDGAFEAVHAGQLLWHLREPVRALREMRRVLRPGGVVGVFDAVIGATRWDPENPLLRRLLTWEEHVLRHHGADVDNARRLAERLVEAGFTRPRTATTVYRLAGAAAARPLVPYFLARFQAPLVVKTLLEEGWATEAELEASWAEVPRWAERPDALFEDASVWALGWAGSE